MTRGGGGIEASIRIEGMPELKVSLSKLMTALGDIGAMRDIAEQAAQLARSFAPVKSGLLQSTIKAGRSKNRAIVRVGSAKVPYAAAINYGWPARNIAPRGFMQKADDAMKPRLPNLIERAVEQLIREGRLD